MATTRTTTGRTKALRRSGTQQELRLDRGWGGRRAGAGRKRLPKGRRRVPHVSRQPLRRNHPVQVTWRVTEHVWNLRSQRGFRALLRAFVPAAHRFGMRITHFSVQGNHVHLLVEVNGRAGLYKALRGLGVRIAKALNRLMGTRGAVFADRYHIHPLATPSEARNAIRYVLGNHAVHASRRGQQVAGEDPFAVGPTMNQGRGALWRRLVGDDPPVAPPQSWLLTEGWRRARA